MADLRFNVFKGGEPYFESNSTGTEPSAGDGVNSLAIGTSTSIVSGGVGNTGNVVVAGTNITLSSDGTTYNRNIIATGVYSAVNATLGGYINYSSLFGVYNTNNNSQRSTIVGYSNTSEDVENSIIVGSSNATNIPAANNAVGVLSVGTGNSIVSGRSRISVVGHDNTFDGYTYAGFIENYDVNIFGNNITTEIGDSYSGYNTFIGTTAIGNDITITGNGGTYFNQLVIGSQTTITGSSGGTAIGSGAGLSYADGAVQLGAGTNSTSNTLQFRSTPVANNFSLQAKTVSGTPTDTAADGTLEVDTINDLLYFRSGGSWVAASGGGGGGEPYVEINSTGTLPTATGVDAVSVGGAANASAANAIQLGAGTNNTANTLQFQNQTIANAFSLQAKTVSGTPTDIASDGTIEIDSTNSLVYYRSDTAWVTAGRIRLEGTKNFYVDFATGNDTNDGETSGTAFATLGRAFQQANKYDLVGGTVRINLLPTSPTYDFSSTIGIYDDDIPTGFGRLLIISSTGNPSDVVLNYTANSTNPAFEFGINSSNIEVVFEDITFRVTDAPLMDIRSQSNVILQDNIVFEKTGTVRTVFVFSTFDKASLKGESSLDFDLTGVEPNRVISVFKARNASTIYLDTPAIDVTGLDLTSGDAGGDAAAFYSSEGSSSIEVINATYVGTFSGVPYAATESGVVLHYERVLSSSPKNSTLLEIPGDAPGVWASNRVGIIDSPGGISGVFPARNLGSVLVNAGDDLDKFYVQGVRDLHRVGRLILEEDIEYRIDPVGGDDTNSGLASNNAFATIERALEIANLYDLNGHTLTIRLNGNVTYNVASTINILDSPDGVGTIIFAGNITFPETLGFSGTVSSLFYIETKNKNITYKFENMTLTNSSGSIFTIKSSRVLLENLYFNITGGGSFAVVTRGDALCQFDGVMDFENSSPFSFFGATDNSVISSINTALPISFNLTNTTVDSANGGAFVSVSRNAFVNFADDITYTGTLTGRQYYVSDDGYFRHSPNNTIQNLATVPGTIDGVWAAQVQGVVDGALPVATPFIRIPDGAINIDTSNDTLYYRSNGAWVAASGGGGGGTDVTVEDDGTPLTTAVTKLNFTGAGVTITEPVADEITITIPGGGGSSPLTTKGDLYTYDTADARLPVGLDGQVLVANSATATGLEWQNPASGGGGGSGASFVDTIGDGAASSFVVTHNLNTRDVFVTVYSTSSPYDVVFPSIEHTTLDTITVDFGVAVPTLDEYTVVISSGGVSGREVLTANRTYYVDPAGSDSNDGLTVGNPFQTIQKAIDVTGSIDPSQYSITIQLADGTYSNGTVILKRHLAQTPVIIKGNSSNNTLVVIDNSSAVENFTILHENSSLWRIQDLTITNNALNLAASAGRNCIYISRASVLTLDNCRVLSTDSNTRGITLDQSSSVEITDFTIEGDFFRIFTVLQQSSIRLASTNLTIASGTSFSNTYLFMTSNCSYNQGSLSITGTATGSRYNANGGCIVRTSNGLDSDVPGSVAGSLQNGSFLTN